MGMWKSAIFAIAFLTGFLRFPSPAPAADPISMNPHEKDRVERGEIIVREIDTAGKDGKTFEAICRIDGSRKDVMRVLTDYETYPEFMPNVSRIEVLDRTDDAAVINYTLALPLGKVKKYRLRLTSSEPEAGVSVLRWHLVEWPGLKPEETIEETNGHWRIEEASDGGSRVLYHVHTDPGHVPFGLGWIVDALSKDSVPEALAGTRTRVEGTPGRSPAAEEDP